MERIAQRPATKVELIKFTNYINSMLKGLTADDDCKRHVFEVKGGVLLPQIELTITGAAAKAKSYGLFVSPDSNPKRLTLIDKEVFMVAENISILDAEFGNYMNLNYSVVGIEKVRDLLRQADKIKTAAVIELKEGKMTVNTFNGQYGDAFFELLREEMSSGEIVEPAPFDLPTY
ncbi:MAG: hypothetical protein KGH71_01280 [Candidatus Micrarchaeota archaeon]|nr:hypothetical protein [Candidatus Micrarchaeota archaeon]